jgi:thiol-disulfide isomerase/thioredoxin
MVRSSLACIALASTVLYACADTTPTSVGDESPSGKSSSGSSGGSSSGKTSSGASSSSSSGNNTVASVPYPSGTFGTLPSTHNPQTGKVGSRGNLIENFKFKGYFNGTEFKDVQMADFYDPTGSKYKVIHMQAAAVWCDVCEHEMEVKKPVEAKLKQQGVAFITVMIEGAAENQASVKADVDLWLNKFKPGYAIVLDPLREKLGVFFDGNSLPWNAYIDARSMEVLQAGVGVDFETSAELEKVMGDWITFLGKNSLAVAK